MPGASDFLSPPVFLQAALALVAALMAWRGLHLAGDKRNAMLWGVASVSTFIVTLFVGAWQNHDSKSQVSIAQTDRAKAQTQLEAIQHTLDAMNGAMAKIADAARVNPNQSTQELANQIVGKLSSMEAQIAQTQSRVSTLEHPPHNPDMLYQDDKPVANFISGRMSSDKKLFEFIEIYNAGSIDFSKEIYFRSLVLKCQPHNIDTGITFEPLGLISNVMQGVRCLVISGAI